ncbi:MAG: hypothetical protein IKM11_02380 [Oscillospiraceae bacterium]|nr:hypothetical protein [Oscillospiraceae bacterium]
MTSYKRLGIFWGMGVGMCILRFMQLTTEFDPSTLLYTRGVAGTALAVLVVVSLVIAFVLSRSGGKDRPLFAECFASPDRSTTALVVAAFLFAAGGVLIGMDSLGADMRIAGLVTAAFALLSCLSLLVLTRKMRGEGARSVVMTLPFLFFAAFWVLTLYLPAASDPVLARYYLPILAASVSAYALAQLAGFFRKETSVRTFRFVASYAVTLCIASIAELNAHSVLFAASALMLSVFLALEGKPSNEDSQ